MSEDQNNPREYQMEMDVPLPDGRQCKFLAQWHQGSYGVFVTWAIGGNEPKIAGVFTEPEADLLAAAFRRLSEDMQWTARGCPEGSDQ